MTRATLHDGVHRLSGASCKFLFERLTPGKYLAVCRGRDDGELGTAPLDLIEREFQLFGRPVEWYLDARQVDYATQSVSRQWTEWLSARKEALASMHILTGNRHTHLIIDVARHFSNSAQHLRLYSDPEKWGSQINLPNHPAGPALADRFDEPGIDARRVETDGGVELTAPACQWSFSILPQNVILTRFSGTDSGALTDLALDEMERSLAKITGKARWFLDLEHASHVATQASNVWTEWLTRRQSRLAGVTAVAESPVFPLVLTIAKFRSGTERLFRIHRNLDAFREELSGVISASAAAV